MQKLRGCFFYERSEKLLILFLCFTTERLEVFPGNAISTTKLEQLLLSVRKCGIYDVRNILAVQSKLVNLHSLYFWNDLEKSRCIVIAVGILFHQFSHFCEDRFSVEIHRKLLPISAIVSKADVFHYRYLLNFIKKIEGTVITFDFFIKGYKTLTREL